MAHLSVVLFISKSSRDWYHFSALEERLFKCVMGKGVCSTSLCTLFLYLLGERTAVYTFVNRSKMKMDVR